jgi:hypothetical protein
VALKVEGVVNRTVQAQEVLGGSSRLEPLGKQLDGRRYRPAPRNSDLLAAAAGPVQALALFIR